MSGFRENGQKNKKSGRAMFSALLSPNFKGHFKTNFMFLESFLKKFKRFSLKWQKTLKITTFCNFGPYHGPKKKMHIFSKIIHGRLHCVKKWMMGLGGRCET